MRRGLAPVAYLSTNPGVIVELEPDVTSCWDYADDAMMPPGEPPI